MPMMRIGLAVLAVLALAGRGAQAEQGCCQGFAQEGSSAGVMPANAGIQGAGRNGFPLSRE